MKKSFSDNSGSTNQNIIVFFLKNIINNQQLRWKDALELGGILILLMLFIKDSYLVEMLCFSFLILFTKLLDLPASVT